MGIEFRFVHLIGPIVFAEEVPSKSYPTSHHPLILVHILPPTVVSRRRKSVGIVAAMLTVKWIDQSERESSTCLVVLSWKVFTPPVTRQTLRQQIADSGQTQNRNSFIRVLVRSAVYYTELETDFDFKYPHYGTSYEYRRGFAEGKYDDI